jgi:DNA-binding XRE family transcriptional regulator
VTKQKAPVRAIVLTRDMVDTLDLDKLDDLTAVRKVIAASIRRLRQEQQMTQAELAGRIASSQPRVAAIEAGDSGVSLDLLIRSFFAAGGTRAQLSRVIGWDRRP